MAWGTALAVVASILVGCSPTVGVLTGKASFVGHAPVTLSGERVVVSQGGRVIAGESLGAGGTYRFSLTPGSYAVTLTGPQTATPSFNAALVSAGRTTHKDLVVVIFGTAPRVTQPMVTVVTATGLHDGEQVQVSLTGFDGYGKVSLSECAMASDANKAGCGQQLAAQPFLGIDQNGSDSGPFTVSETAPGKPYDLSQLVPCTTRCVLVATGGIDGGFAYAAIGFGP
jgi:hypothetical protein